MAQQTVVGLHGVSFGAFVFLSCAIGALSDLIANDFTENLNALVLVPLLATLGCGAMAFVAFVARVMGRDISKPRMKRWLAITGILIVCGISSVMLATMIPSIQRATDAAKDAAAQNSPWIEHTFADGQLSIHTPANWELYTEGVIDPGVVWLWDRSNDLHLVATGAPRVDLAVSNFSEFARSRSLALAQDYEQHTIGETVLRKRGEFRVADTTLQTVVDGMNLVFNLRHVECGDYWVDVKLWSTPSKRAAHQETFTRIADSVRRNQ